METQIQINGQKFVISEEIPQRFEGYHQWIWTGGKNGIEYFNVDGSTAPACYNGALVQLGERLLCTQEVGSSSLPCSTIVSLEEKIPTADWEHGFVECYQGDRTIVHWIVDEWTDHDVNESQIMRISDDIIEINTKERGVGQVPSCGSATVAAAYWWSKGEHPVTVMCRGGGYRVEFTKTTVVLSKRLSQIQYYGEEK